MYRGLIVLPLSVAQYGLPLDSNADWVSRTGESSEVEFEWAAHGEVVDWMMFTAAIATDNSLRDALISQLHAYASPNKQNQPFEIVYNPLTGDQTSGSSRFVRFVVLLYVT